jgi:succinoglycan biosynthesis transport protein ExoP
MTLQQLLSILRARWKAIVIIWASLMSVVVAGSLFLPEKYEASTDVVVDIKSSDSVMGSFSPQAMLLPSYLGTQADILKSRRVTDRVIDALHLDTNPLMVQAWSDATDGVGDIRSWLFNSMSKALDITPSRDSNLITITYTTASAQFAATVANTYAQAYIDTVLDMRVSPAGESAAWFKDRVETLRQEVDRAQVALSDYRREKGILGDSQARLGTENTRLDELTNQLTIAQAQNADVDSRSVRSGDLSSSPEVMQNSLVQSLRAQVADTRARIQDAGSRLGQNHPEYKRLVAQLRETEAQLNTQIARVASSLTISGEQGTRKISSLAESLEEQKKKVIALSADMDRLGVLQHELDVAESSYQAISQRYLQSNLESQSTTTNISVVSQAVPPDKAKFPNWPKNIAIGVVFGMMFGVAGAMLLELSDRRLRSASDFEIGVGMPLPLLGSIPATSKSLSAAEKRHDRQLAGPKGSNKALPRV